MVETVSAAGRPAELDGRPVELAELQALAMTNYGHFTTMRVEDGGVRGLGLHLERLVAGGRRLLDAELDTALVRAHVRHALRGVARPVVVRVTIFDPTLDAGDAGADAEPHVLVTTRAAPALPCAPLRLRSAPYQRDLAEVKHTGVFGAMHHRRAAQRAGYDDVVFVDGGGNLGELATANLALVRDDQLVWPDAAVLGGVTGTLLERTGIGPGRTQPVPLEALDGIQAAVALSSVVAVRTIERIDDHHWSAGHPLVDALRTAYAAVPCEPI